MVIPIYDLLITTGEQRPVALLYLATAVFNPAANQTLHFRQSEKKINKRDHQIVVR